MKTDRVWAGCLIRSAADPAEVTPCYWVAIVPNGSVEADVVVWGATGDKDGLIRPYQFHWDATQHAAAVVARGEVRAAAVVACDRLPPGSETIGATGREPQAVVADLFIAPELIVRGEVATVGNRDDLAQFLSDLYGGTATLLFPTPGAHRNGSA